MSIQNDLHDDLEEDGVHDSNFYGVKPGIVGVLLGVAIIIFMFILADGFS